MGTFFTSKHGLGSRGPGGTPPSKPKSSTPPGSSGLLKHFFQGYWGGKVCLWGGKNSKFTENCWSVIIVIFLFWRAGAEQEEGQILHMGEYPHVPVCAATVSILYAICRT